MSQKSLKLLTCSHPRHAVLWARIGHPRCPCEPGDGAANRGAPSRRRPCQDRASVRSLPRAGHQRRGLPSFPAILGVLDVLVQAPKPSSSPDSLSLSLAKFLLPPFLNGQSLSTSRSSTKSASYPPWIPNPLHPKIPYLPSSPLNPLNHSHDPHLAGNPGFPGRQSEFRPNSTSPWNSIVRPPFPLSKGSNRL